MFHKIHFSLNQDELAVHLEKVPTHSSLEKGANLKFALKKTLIREQIVFISLNSRFRDCIILYVFSYSDLFFFLIGNILERSASCYSRF